MKINKVKDTVYSINCSMDHVTNSTYTLFSLLFCKSSPTVIELSDIFFGLNFGLVD